MPQTIFIQEGQSPESAQKRYEKRRQAFMKENKHPVVIFGIPFNCNLSEPWLTNYSPLFQEPFFLYLTGINQPNVVLVMDPKTKTERLYLPKKDPSKSFWEGFHIGCGSDDAVLECQELTGFKDIRSTKDLVSDLAEMSKNESLTLSSFWFEKVENYHQASIKKLTKQLKNKGIKKLAIHNTESLTYPLRLCLDPIDLGHLQIANKKTGDVFLSIIKSVHHAKSEQDIYATLTGGVMKQSQHGHSFAPIVAHGKNAAVLHYQQNNAKLHKKSLLLLDFGVKVFTMPADVSRTIPLSGTFNPMQRILYQCVLDVQSHIESLVKAGVTIQFLNTECWNLMETLLEERFGSIGGKWQRPYHIQPHNVGHFLAHMVHDGDPNRHYRNAPLKSGQVITNEPGLYGTFSVTLQDVHYHECLGIRIEDNLLVTKKGCENLTSAIPKKIDIIEHLLRKYAANAEK